MIREELTELLLSLFDRSGLEHFLAYCEVGGQPVGEVLGEDLPSRGTDRVYAQAAVDALVKRELISQAFTNALLLERPHRKVDINKLAERLAWDHPPQRGVVGRTSSSPFAREDLFVGRTTELESVIKYLRAGKSALLIGGRRAGKTSLIKQISAEDLGRNLYQTDIARWEPSSEAVLIEKLGGLFDRSCYTRAQLERVLRSHAPLTIILDEAERLLGRPWTGSFFAFLRSLDDAHGMGGLLSFLLVGGPALHEYRDPENEGSPVLNTAEEVFLRPLELQARRLLLGLLDVSVSEDELFRAVGGHPWLLVRVLDRISSGDELHTALNHVGQHSQQHFQTWKRQAGRGGLALLDRIPPEGLEDSDFNSWPPGPLRSLVSEWNILQCIGLVDRREGRTLRGPELVLSLWGGA